MVAATTDTGRPLTDDEKSTLRALMEREAAFTGPATRTGEPYEALINLSVPRRVSDKDRNTDLVMAGETIYLTAEEAAQFNRHGVRDGRQVPVLRKMTGPDGTSEPAQRLLPRHVSGRLFRPAVPPPGSDQARPDPAGSSRIEVIDDGRAPEAEGAVSADPGEMADHLREQPQDAVDLPPRRSRGRAQ